MDFAKITIGIVSLSLIVGATTFAFSKPVQTSTSATSTNRDGEENDEEQIIALDKAPETVRNAIVKIVGDAKNITRVIQEEDEEDSISYEVEYTINEVKCSAALSPAGEVIELEQGTTEAKLPAAVMAALKKEYPNATFADPYKVTRITYEVDIVINGKKHEMEVDPAGNISDESQMTEKSKEEAKPEAKPESKEKPKQ